MKKKTLIPKNTWKVLIIIYGIVMIFLISTNLNSRLTTHLLDNHKMLCMSSNSTLEEVSKTDLLKENETASKKVMDGKESSNDITTIHMTLSEVIFFKNTVTETIEING